MTGSLRPSASCAVRAVFAAGIFGAFVVLAAPIDAAFEPGACDGQDHALVEADRPTEVREKRGRFEALPDVSLSPKVEGKLNALAETYQRRLGRTFVVTSGTRGPDDQADVFVAKLEAGDDVVRLYRDKVAVLELKKIFETGRVQKTPRAAVVAQIASAIRAQMKRGVFISAHLKAGAADVRSTNMTGVERRVFLEAAREVGGVAVLVETIPPHFHLQMQ